MDGGRHRSTVTTSQYCMRARATNHSHRGGRLPRTTDRCATPRSGPGWAIPRHPAYYLRVRLPAATARALSASPPTHLRARIHDQRERTPSDEEPASRGSAREGPPAARGAEEAGSSQQGPPPGRHRDRASSRRRHRRRSSSSQSVKPGRSRPEEHGQRRHRHRRGPRRPSTTPALAAGRDARRRRRRTRPASVANIRVYVDYLCPYCDQFERTNAEQLEQWLESGAATLEIHPIALLDEPSRTAPSTRCVRRTPPPASPTTRPTTSWPSTARCSRTSRRRARPASRTRRSSSSRRRTPASASYSSDRARASRRQAGTFKSWVERRRPTARSRAHPELRPQGRQRNADGARERQAVHRLARPTPRSSRSFVHPGRGRDLLDVDPDADADGRRPAG